MANNANTLSQLTVNDKGFVFDPNTGQGYTANAQGRLIIKALGKNEPAKAILDEILDMFQVSSQEAERDLEEFMDQLRCHNLITEPIKKETP